MATTSDCACVGHGAEIAVCTLHETSWRYQKRRIWLIAERDRLTNVVDTETYHGALSAVLADQVILLRREIDRLEQSIDDLRRQVLDPSKLFAGTAPPQPPMEQPLANDTATYYKD